MPLLRWIGGLQGLSEVDRGLQGTVWVDRGTRDWLSDRCRLPSRFRYCTYEPLRKVMLGDVHFDSDLFWEICSNMKQIFDGVCRLAQLHWKAMRLFVYSRATISLMNRTFCLPFYL